MQLLVSSLLMVLVSCVPKATEKKANCGTDQAFNSVTRECVSTQKARNKPVATTANLTFTENQAADFILQYSDKDSDLAVTCKVTDNDSKIEMYSPKMNEALTETKTLYDYLALANSVHNSQIPGGTHIATINANLSDIQNDIETIEMTYSITNISTLYEGILLKVDESYNLMKNYTTSSSLVYFNNSVRDQLAVARPLIAAAQNRCYCDGAGVCKTRGGVVQKSVGPAAFTYTVTDAIDGVSNSKQVTVAITNVNDAPLASFYFENGLNESANNTPVSTAAINFPAGYDADGNSLTFIKVTNPTQGSVSCNSSSCTYTPTSGNTNTTSAVSFGSTNFFGVNFTALHYGSWSNGLTFRFKNFNLTEERYFYSGPFLEINYPIIDFYFPLNYSFTPDVLVDLINNHPYLSLLGTATDTSGGATQLIATLPQSFVVAGGAGGFDSFDFKYRDSNGAESNIGKVIINLHPTNDPPTPQFVTPSPAATITRNGTVTDPVAFSNVNLYNADGTLYYTDPDATNNVASACMVSFSSFTPGVPATVALNTIPAKAELGACVCDVIDGDANDGKCTYEIRSTYRTSPGSVNVYYAFYDGVNWSTSIQSMPVTITPSNVAPSLETAAATLNTTINEDDTWTEVISVPIWANDQVAGDSEIISGSTQQTLQYSMGLTVGGNPDLYDSTTLSNSFRIKYETCSPVCTTATVTTSTGLTNYITLGTGNGVTGVLKNLNLEFKPQAEQSGNFQVTFRLRDVSPTTGETSLLSADWTNTITVNNVNDPPLIHDTDVQALVTAAGTDPEVKITTVETAENSQALSRTFIVDEGGDSAEDADELSINSISSDNTTLLPLNRVEVIFDRDGDGLYEKDDTNGDLSFTSDDDDNEVFLASEALPIDLEDSSVNNNEDSKGTTSMLVGRRLLFKINPTPGNYGIANIRFTLRDSGTGTPSSLKTYVVAVIVHPVSTIHGGWSHLQAQGIKLTKRGTSLTSAYNCASGARVSGSGAPSGIVTSHATDDMDIYYDSTYKNCYYATLENSKNHWFSLNTYCPISKKCKSTNDKACLFESTDPSIASLATTLGENEVYGVIDTSTHALTCFRIDNQTAVNYTPSSVVVSWKAFSISTSSGSITPVLSKYRVFRRKLNEEYDLTKPLGEVAASKLSYTDTTAFGGIAYYYKIVPVVTFDSKTINVFPSENFSEVRMVAPPANYSFVHRWMANQEVCNKMGFTVNMAAPNRVDPTNNYRCPYRGPGETAGFYDIGNDYLVDTFENGCPFTETPLCTVNGSLAACIGMNAPGAPVPLDGTVYYERAAGKCHVARSGAWQEYDDVPGLGDTAGFVKATIASNSITNFNPPAVNITRTNANAFCAMRSAVNIQTNGASTATGGFTLPNRKEQIAFFAGPMEKQASNDSYNEYADSSIQTIEDGQSLNTNAYCNSNYANGLESSFVDADYPPSSLLYSLPGNSSSTIRSLVTGSVEWGSLKGTTMCLSRYGMQDVYGNVSEWVSDDFEWYDDPGVDYPSVGGVNYDYIRSNEAYLLFDADGGGANNDRYVFNYAMGPCNDSTSDNLCSSGDTLPTPDWDIAERFYGATRLAFAVGLPFTDQFVTSYSLSPIHDYLLDIGRASGGISSAGLHSDKFIINDNRPNQDTAYSAAAGKVSMSTGGNYTSGNASGRYSFELVPADHVDEKTGFRCRAIVNY